MKFLSKLKNKITKEENKADLPPDLPTPKLVGVEEVLDLKSLVVPKNAGEIYSYYVFCKDPKAKDDKHFMYYKRIISSERDLASAQNMVNLMNAKYSIIILKYNVRTQIVENCHEGESDFYKAQIDRFEELKTSAAKSLNFLENK